MINQLGNLPSLFLTEAELRETEVKVVEERRVRVQQLDVVSVQSFLSAGFFTGHSVFCSILTWQRFGPGINRDQRCAVFRSVQSDINHDDEILVFSSFFYSLKQYVCTGASA